MLEEKKDIIIFTMLEKDKTKSQQYNKQNNKEQKSIQQKEAKQRRIKN